MQNQSTPKPRSDSRWPAVAALFASAGLYYALPERLTAGPRWELFPIIGVLLIPATLAKRAGRTKLNSTLGLILSGVITLAMISSLGVLIAGLPQKRESPRELLQAALALWLSNVLVFASWYWRLDAGGLHLREKRTSHTEGDFLFPQMVLPQSMSGMVQGWKPGFVDYLFLAFNTSTAFSPTDVPVLSRWAKVLMMTQSVISLGTVVILAARAVNIL